MTCLFPRLTLSDSFPLPLLIGVNVHYFLVFLLGRRRLNHKAVVAEVHPRLIERVPTLWEKRPKAPCSLTSTKKQALYLFKSHWEIQEQCRVLTASQAGVYVMKGKRSMQCAQTRLDLPKAKWPEETTSAYSRLSLSVF